MFIIDEGKSSRPSRVAIQHYLNLLHRTKPAKLFLQFLLRGVEAEAEYSNTSGLRRSITVPGMTPPGGHRRARALIPSTLVVVITPGSGSRPGAAPSPGPPGPRAAPFPTATASPFTARAASITAPAPIPTATASAS